MRGGSTKALEAGCVGGEVAGVEGIEDERCARREWRWEVKDSLGRFAGVVSVGVDDVLGYGERGGTRGSEDARRFPMEGGGDLQGNAGERLAGDVAKGEAGARGEMAGRRGHARVEVVGGEEEAGTLLIGKDRAGGGLAGGCGLRLGRGVGVGGGGWSAVTLEEDLALWRGRGGGRGRRRGLSMHGQAREKGEGKEVDAVEAERQGVW